MSDEQIERAIEGVIAVANSNFPGECEVKISTHGKNSATISLPAYALSGILEFAKKGRSR